MSEHGDVPEPFLVVAHDGSPAARSAATVTIQIARSQHLLVRGLYVIDAPLVLDPYTNYQAELGSAERPASHTELIDQFEERGQAALQWLESQCRAGNVAATATIKFGRVPTVVLEEAASATLLVLGRRGHGHATEPDYLGHHFRAIAHPARQPLLVGGDEARPVQRLLLAYNGSERAQRALVWASLLQRTLSTEVVAVAVEEDTDPTWQWSREMEIRLAQSDLADHGFVCRRGQPAAEIVAAATDNRIDLIVMGGYRHGGLLEWLVGSTTDQVLRHTPLPVLVV